MVFLASELSDAVIIMLVNVKMRTIVGILIATNQGVVAARSGNNESWLLLRLEAMFCSIHLLYEGLISVLSTESSGIYTESIRSN